LIIWAPSHILGYIFGLFCVLQGLLLFYSLKKSDITIGKADKTNSIIGIVIIIYAIIGYQLLGYFMGHTYLNFFPPGLVPCPTTILTFGIFLIINKIPTKYFVIPFLASLGGILASYSGIYEDIGLVITGIFGTFLLMRSNAQFKSKN